MESETEFLLRRASEEALNAIKSDEPQASDVHEVMAIEYSVKAATLLSEDDTNKLHSLVSED